LELTVKTTVSPKVRKVIQDPLKMSDQTELDILNRSVEVMVEAFPTEFLPVAADCQAGALSFILPLHRSLTEAHTRLFL
jgi:hypothetical protein